MEILEQSCHCFLNFQIIKECFLKNMIITYKKIERVNYLYLFYYYYGGNK